MINNFYSLNELKELGFASVGENVLISRKASIYSPAKISIGSNVRIDDFCILSGGQGIRLGSYVHIAAYSALYGGGGVSVGDFCGVSPRVTLLSESDDFLGNSLPQPFFPKEFKPIVHKGKITLVKHCQIGMNSSVMPGVTLDEGVAIGAHSLVMKDCEEWSVYFGTPAKRFSARKKDILDLEIKFLTSLSR